MTFGSFSTTIINMSSCFQSKKTLVIDNSLIITKIIKNFLTQTGFKEGNIFVAHDKNQAMMMFELEKFDLITSGIHLRDSSGIDLLHEIRGKSNEAQKKIPFLIISSENQDTYQEELDKHSGTDYLRKPFKQDQFKQTILGILNITDASEPVAAESASPASTPDCQWEESPVEIPAPIIEAFTTSTVEAMEQYMAEAIPQSSKDPVELNGYFSAWLDLMDAENRIQTTLLINFPKNAACGIYEEIFGDVDIEQVCGVVQELANIIGGIVKPKISEFSTEIAQLLNDQKENVTLSWALGLPEAKMGEGHSLDMKLNGVPKFHVPFKIKEETFHLVVLIQNF